MKYKYDNVTDILIIEMSEESPDFAEQKENIITHYNKEGKPIEIEILDASDTASKIISLILASKKKIV